MPRVLQISDTHLSRTHPLFQFNFEIALREIARVQPDVVVYTGDLALNGPSNPDDVVYASEQLARTPVAWLAVPGNHDIGLVPSDAHKSESLTPQRRAAYLAAFHYDRFAAELGGWRLVGINSQLMGSGLPEEEEQFAWLREQLEGRDLPVALFMHYPVFARDPQETDQGLHSVAAGPRARLLDIMQRAGNVRLVGTGHLHQARSSVHAGVRHEWAPSSAFTIPGTALDTLGGQQVTGMLLHELTAGGMSTRVIEPELMMQMDLRNWSKAKPHGYYQVVGQPWLLDARERATA